MGTGMTRERTFGPSGPGGDCRTITAQYPKGDIVHLPTRWTHRTLARTEQAAGPSVSTLELFFDEVRWKEDTDPSGRRTLQRGRL